MAPTLDAQATESQARELLNHRITSVRSLVTARQALVDAREQLTRAEADDTKAYRAALSDGWTTDELRKLGLADPHDKPRARRRANSRHSAPNTSTAS